MIRARVSGGSTWLVLNNVVGVVDQPKKENESVGVVACGSKSKLTIKNVTINAPGNPPFCMEHEPRLMRAIWAMNPKALPYAKDCVSAAKFLRKAVRRFVDCVRGDPLSGVVSIR